MVATRKNSTGTSGEFRVRSNFHPPPADFDGCFTSFYHFSLEVDDGGTISDHLQPEWGSIRFFAGSQPMARIGESSLENARFCATGPSTLPVHFELGPCTMWGIGFLPLGWARFIDRDAQDFCNTACDGESTAAFAKFAPLVEALCREGADSEEQLDTIAQLLRDLMRPTRDDEKILRVHAAMVDPGITNVADFAESSAMSVRSLERLCCRYFGFSPKLLLRRQRFMRSLVTFMLDPRSNWSDAMDAHYHDQAQFTREFRQFMGMSPTQYAAQDHPILASFVEARARMLGSAALTLDKPS